MKKKVLFLITNLAHGGAERVLVNLANNLDKSKYDVTVMTIFDTGVNKQYLSSEVCYRSIFPKIFHGIKYITALLPGYFLHRLFIREQYDYEVSYLEGPPAKIVSGCTNPNTKKAAWIHIELLNDGAFTEGFRNKEDAIISYNKFDRIVCVSQTVRDCFSKVSGITDKVNYSDLTNKDELINKGYNIIKRSSLYTLYEDINNDKNIEKDMEVFKEDVKNKVLVIQKEVNTNYSDKSGCVNLDKIIGNGYFGYLKVINVNGKYQAYITLGKDNLVVENYTIDNIKNNKYTVTQKDSKKNYSC